jgi:small subunit ribosomal protein S7
MSRKKTQPKKVVIPDPIFNSTIIPKLINSIMYDAKIVYDAIEKIKSKTKEEPINVFNEAINNIKPTVEVRSRRVGGATYQVPVEVKTKRAQALAIRWLVDASRKRKDKHMSDKIFNELYDAYEKKGSAVKKREDVHKMAESNKAFAHFRW